MDSSSHHLVAFNNRARRLLIQSTGNTSLIDDLDIVDLEKRYSMNIATGQRPIPNLQWDKESTM